MNIPETVIPISKTKSSGAFIGSIAFVVASVWITMAQPMGEILSWIVGGIGIVFFGATTYYSSRAIFQNKPGLVLDEEGITDYSSGVAAGFIPWKDVEEIQTTKVFSQSFILIMVQNPETYLDRAESIISRRAMEANFNSYGTPITISANSLKISFEELVGVFEGYFPH